MNITVLDGASEGPKPCWKAARETPIRGIGARVLASRTLDVDLQEYKSAITLILITFFKLVFLMSANPTLSFYLLSKDLEIGTPMRSVVWPVLS